MIMDIILIHTIHYVCMKKASRRIVNIFVKPSLDLLQDNHYKIMVWYGMVTLFKHGISFRYTFIEKTNFLTSLKTKIKEIKLIKMKRKHLLFKEAVCKNRISLVKLFINQNLCLLIFPYFGSIP